MSRWWLNSTSAKPLVLGEELLDYRRTGLILLCIRMSLISADLSLRSEHLAEGRRGCVVGARNTETEARMKFVGLRNTETGAKHESVVSERVERSLHSAQRR